MNDEIFWAFIDSVKGSDDELAHTQRLAVKLEALSNDQLVQFKECYQANFDLANTGDLWAAGMLLNGGHGSDDGFEYFRNWLIAQGSSVFRLAISAPDTLAAIELDTQNGFPTAEWESFGGVASDVLSKRNGASLHGSAMPNLNPVTLTVAPPFDSSGYSNETIAIRLPKLWRKYGNAKMRRDQEVADHVKESESRMKSQAFQIPGLGEMKAGVVLYHKKFGAGTVIGIEDSGLHFVAAISFSGTVRHMLLTATPELFSRHPFK